MNSKEKYTLASQYQGNNADTYDKNRILADRHIREEAIFREYFTQASPKTVLDCPVGTMRWFDIYAQSTARILGVDLSADMIKNAKAKVDNNGLGERFAFKQGNILDNSNPVGDDSFDMVVCVRFINWIPANMAYDVVAYLSKRSTNYFLLGATVLPEKWSVFRKLKAKYILLADNKKRKQRKTAVRYVHPEKQLERFLSENGWAIRSKKPTMENKDAVNYLYLLQRK